MRPLTESELRASFVNCSKGVAQRLPMPRSLGELDWGSTDFLGWRDAGAPLAAYLVAPVEDGHAGLVLRLSGDRGRGRRQNMCSLCLTLHSGTDIALMVAARPGQRGRDGNTVGTYLCADLQCSRYARGLKKPDRVQPPETLSVESRVQRVQENLATFMRRVLA